jgi:hypothetical protein
LPDICPFNMNKVLSVSIVFLFILCSSATAQVLFDQKYTNVGRLGLAISNVGTLGRPTVRSNTQGIPSMEYPLNSGIEHLFEGGLWIGALVNGQQLVSTSALDAANGYSTGANGFEFTAVGPITERSSLRNKDNFSTNAISHQDFIVNFTDKNVVVPGVNIPIANHTNPLVADVRLESYSWNYSYADFFVILNYEVTNNSSNQWDSVYLGMWSDMVVRNVNVTQDNGTAFFNKGRGGFERDLSALYVYQQMGDDVDYTQSYAAAQILGVTWRDMYIHPSNAKSLLDSGYAKPVINPNFWYYNSTATPFTTPQNDQERYFKLKNGLDSMNLINGPNKITGNWIQLISIGPVSNVKPGEKFRFAVAMVCAKQKDSGDPNNKDTKEARKELTDHLSWAKRTFLGEDLNENGQLDAGEDLNTNNQLDRFILPEPPATPKVKMVPSNNQLDIYWDKSSMESIDPISKKKDFEGFRLYRTNLGDDQGTDLLSKANLIAQWDSAGNTIGFNNGFTAIKLDDPVVIEEDTFYFHYKLTGLLNGWQYLVILTAFDEGDVELGLDALESSLTENSYGVFAGTEPNPFSSKGDGKKVGVYPNPYKGSALWDGTTSRTKKIYFYNLPSRCEITIYTASGDVVSRINHNAGTYKGEDSRWFENFAGAGTITFSGGEHAWDMLTETKNQVSSGIYLFAVKDLDSQGIKMGKFVILK